MTLGWLFQRLEGQLLQRRAAAHLPLRALVTLPDNTPTEAARRFALCLELGLVDRARRTLAASGLQPTPPQALQLAWLEGDFATFDRLATAPGTAIALATASPAEQNKCLGWMTARAPAQAMALLRSLRRMPPCAPAVAQRAGAEAEARAWRHRWPWRLQADYLLLDANEAPTPATQIQRLNDYLACHGLSALAPIDATRPPSVGNLRSARARPSSPTVAPVSVIMPCHNNAVHIQASIGSLLAQTRPPQEILVVDDASADDTPQLVEALATKHPSVHLIRLSTHGGAYVARNAGLAAARAPYVAFHDADDYAHPERLARQLAPLEADASVHASTSRCVRLADDGHFGETRIWPLTRWTPISLLMRREPVLARIGAFEEVRVGADSEYVARLRLMLGEHSHRLLPEPLALFGQRAGSLTTDTTTGFDAQGYSAARIAYQEAWTERHLAALRDGRSLYRPLPNEPTQILRGLSSF